MNSDDVENHSTNEPIADVFDNAIPVDSTKVAVINDALQPIKKMYIQRKLEFG